MLWVYGSLKYFYAYSAGIDYSRHNLTSVDVRFWRLKSIPALYGLNTEYSDFCTGAQRVNALSANLNYERVLSGFFLGGGGIRLINKNDQIWVIFTHLKLR